MNDEIMDELKRCPFCGDDAAVMRDGDGYLIRCSNEKCGVLCHTASLYYPVPYYDASKDGDA